MNHRQRFGKERPPRGSWRTLKPVGVALFLALFVACSGDGASDQSADVTVETECADAPDPSEVGANPRAYPDLQETILWGSMCEERGQIRRFWPDGISKEEALAYADRLCQAGANRPPTPQEWYDLHSGPSSEVDDFALAIADDIAAGRGRGFGTC
jgi:hypothetical protein